MARYMSGMDVLSHDDVLELLRRSVTEAGSQSAWADRHGLRQSTVADVLRGRWPPGPRILAALGLERVTGYRRASAEAIDDAADRIRQAMERWQKIGPGEWDIAWKDEL